MAAPQDANPELESFREQWRAEVRARNTVPAAAAPAPAQQQQQQQHGNTFIREETPKAIDPEPPRPTHLGSGKPPKVDDKDYDDDDYVQARAFDDPEPAQPARQEDKQRGEPVTALDHYERAVEREAAGSLGDSLSLYRKAFRVRATPCKCVQHVPYLR